MRGVNVLHVKQNIRSLKHIISRGLHGRRSDVYLLRYRYELSANVALDSAAENYFSSNILEERAFCASLRGLSHPMVR